MGWVIFVAGAVLSWGVYGALLHLGQTQLGNPLKALLCVGVAYFLIGVIVPVAALSAQGSLSNFNTNGLIAAGFDLHVSSLREVADYPISVHCPHCGIRHHGRLADGCLSDDLINTSEGRAAAISLPASATSLKKL